MQDVAAIFEGQEFVGYSELSQMGQTEILKKIWSEIKKTIDNRTIISTQSSDHNER